MKLSYGDVVKCINAKSDVHEHGVITDVARGVDEIEFLLMTIDNKCNWYKSGEIEITEYCKLRIPRGF
jgi:hypothetical protein